MFPSLCSPADDRLYEIPCLWAFAMPKDSSDSNNVVEIDFSGRNTPKKSHPASPQDRALSEKKRALFDKWLSYGTVSLLFDARAPGVKVPQEFSERGDLRLNFSHDFLVPDFNYNDMSVWASLSFDSGEFFCLVPWRCVYGLQSEKLNQGAVWFDSFPSDYDQVKVLGFSEEMCEEYPTEKSPLVAMSDEAEVGDTDNVVELNFSPGNDTA